MPVSFAIEDSGSPSAKRAAWLRTHRGPIYPSSGSQRPATPPICRYKRRESDTDGTVAPGGAGWGGGIDYCKKFTREKFPIYIISGIKLASLCKPEQAAGGGPHLLFEVNKVQAGGAMRGSSSRISPSGLILSSLRPYLLSR